LGWVVLTSAVRAQSDTQGRRIPGQEAREIWNRVFKNAEGAGARWEANQFLADVASSRKAGTALDIGMGQGRNSLLLARQGWRVTGFDISDEAVGQARAAAAKAGLEITAEVDDVYAYDYGSERWDLVIAMYMHSLIVPGASKIVDSLKPGGLLVIEGFHRDLNQESVQGGYFGYQTNELLKVFDGLRVVYYEDIQDEADWGKGWDGKEKPIVRFVARKDPALPN